MSHIADIPFDPDIATPEQLQTMRKADEFLTGLAFGEAWPKGFTEAEAIKLFKAVLVLNCAQVKRHYVTRDPYWWQADGIGQGAAIALRLVDPEHAARFFDVPWAHGVLEHFRQQLDCLK